jgi:xanthine/uracil/vitamin C permease (AzgA family)
MCPPVFILIIICLTTLSITQGIYHRIIGWWVNVELEQRWKEVAVT